MRSSIPTLSASLAMLGLAACGAPDPETGPAAPNAPEAQASSTPPVLTRDQIEQASVTAPPRRPMGVPPPASPEAAMLRIQILLDRSAFSPGQIDGLGGENTRQAIAAYRKANDLGAGDQADAALLQALTTADGGPVTGEYVLTQADVSGPFSPPPGEDMAAQAANGVNYSTALERIAERFHISETLLQGLNPGVDFRSAGARIVVPQVDSPALAEVARIDVDKAEKAIRAYDASGKLVAFYPATIGSTDTPSPSGNGLKVNGVARAPDYTYDPSRLSYGPGGEKVVVPAGPNNPVGSVWIDLSKDTFGIHGTPDPAKIGKTASHGCVRLTNWDAEQLAAAVKPGVTVRFI